MAVAIDFDTDDFFDVVQAADRAGPGRVYARCVGLLIEVRRLRRLCREMGVDPDTGETKRLVTTSTRNTEVI